MGIIRRIFAKLVARKAKNDPDFIKAVGNADKAMDRLAAQIKKMEANGTKIPDSIKKQAGLINENKH